MNGFFQVPKAINEPVYEYAPGSIERKKLKEALAEARTKVLDIPMFIGADEVRTGNLIDIFPPHDIHHKIGAFHRGHATHVQQAIDAALAAKPMWELMTW